jgi:rubrerythrin
MVWNSRPASSAASLANRRQTVYEGGRSSAREHAREETMEFDSIEDILDYAIAREEEAEALYNQLADRVTRPGMRQTFLHFAAEERGHKERLLRIKAGELPAVTEQQVRDLGIADHLVEPEPTANMTYQEALLFAMKSEKSAFTVYSKLAELTDDAGFARVFQSLAQEEAKHKLRFEIEYDDHVLEGN